MWKKDEEKDPAKSPDAVPVGARERKASDGEGSSEPAIIGPSIVIQGDVSGDEDLLIHGRVDGSVDLARQAVTVGREGRVNANITGRVVIVEGQVEGNLNADEQVILRSAAKVEGDITSPRVVLEDGANFKGLVDMSNPTGGSGRGERGSPGKSRISPGGSGVSKETGDSTSGAGAEANGPDEGPSKATGASAKAEKAAS